MACLRLGTRFTRTLGSGLRADRRSRRLHLRARQGRWRRFHVGGLCPANKSPPAARQHLRSPGPAAEPGRRRQAQEHPGVVAASRHPGTRPVSGSRRSTACVLENRHPRDRSTQVSGRGRTITISGRGNSLIGVSPTFHTSRQERRPDLTTRTKPHAASEAAAPGAVSPSIQSSKTDGGSPVEDAWELPASTRSSRAREDADLVGDHVFDPVAGHDAGVCTRESPLQGHRTSAGYTDRSRRPRICAKSLRLRVTSARPPSIAVAAISASGSRILVSRRMRPARSAIPRSTGISRKGARRMLTDSLAVVPASSSARVITE